VVPRGAIGRGGPEAAVTARGDRATPLVLVVGTDAASLPGIDSVAGVVELRDADTSGGAPARPMTDVDAILAWHPPPGWLAESWGRLPGLRWIQTASAGVDMLLFPELVESDVVVTNARGVFEEPIGEWVVAAMLAFTTGLHRSILDQGRAVWSAGRTTERLAGSRLAVVGPGPIGQAAGRRALSLGMSVTLVGRRPRRHETFGEVLGTERLHAALGEADHVLDALPLTEGTRGLFDRAAFAAMRPGARFYNVGRGATVDEAALVGALEAGTIAGAALDVFADEPLPVESPLWTMPQVIVSPHISGDVVGWERQVVGIFVENARRFAAGLPLENVVDKEAGHGAGEAPQRGGGLPRGPSRT
jgi:phosphoglycerate dehydrogenase-like enzyme